MIDRFLRNGGSRLKFEKRGDWYGGGEEEIVRKGKNAALTSIALRKGLLKLEDQKESSFEVKQSDSTQDFFEVSGLGITLNCQSNRLVNLELNQAYCLHFHYRYHLIHFPLHLNFHFHS